MTEHRVRELVVALAEGNPGALNVLAELDTIPEFNKLEEMGLRGSAIWIAYKDICGQDIERLRAKIADGSIEAEVKATKDWQFEHQHGGTE